VYARGVDVARAGWSLVRVGLRAQTGEHAEVGTVTRQAPTPATTAPLPYAAPESSMLLLALACTGSPGANSADTASVAEPRAYGAAFDADLLEAHVRALASEELAGRKAGSEGDALAVAYVQEALEAAGFEAPEGGWQQPFVDSKGTDSLNVLGVRRGADARVGDEIVIVGAHHDHLGQRRDGSYFPGANDNASGMAVLLGLAEAFGAGQALDRTLVLGSWGSEEVNLDGSRVYVENPPSDLPIDDTVFYVNLDMVGAYEARGTLYALDAARGTVAREVVSAAAANSPLHVDMRYLGELSDSVNFCEAGVPEVFFWTDDPDCYHQTCDTADRLDYDDLSEVGWLVGDVLGRLLGADLDLAGPRAEGCPVD